MKAPTAFVIGTYVYRGVELYFYFVVIERHLLYKVIY